MGIDLGKKSFGVPTEPHRLNLSVEFGRMYQGKGGQFSISCSTTKYVCSLIVDIFSKCPKISVFFAPVINNGVFICANSVNIVLNNS